MGLIFGKFMFGAERLKQKGKSIQKLLTISPLWLRIEWLIFEWLNEKL